MARFEVLGLNADGRFPDENPDSVRIRAAVHRTISGEPPKKGGILNALRRSPLAVPISI